MVAVEVVHPDSLIKFTARDGISIQARTQPYSWVLVFLLSGKGIRCCKKYFIKTLILYHFCEGVSLSLFRQIVIILIEDNFIHSNYADSRLKHFKPRYLKAAAALHPNRFYLSRQV
jgi:hypothetical protein